MIRNYIKTVVRNILRHKGYSFINISGQAIGMACCMLIFIWVNNEQSYDRFHEHANNIHRVVINWPQGMQTEWASVTPPPLAAALKSEIPEVHATARSATLSSAFRPKGLLRHRLPNCIMYLSHNN